MENKSAPEQNTENKTEVLAKEKLEEQSKESFAELSEEEKKFLELDPILEDQCNEITDEELLWLLLEDRELAKKLIEKYNTFDYVCNFSYDELVKLMPPKKARLIRLCRSVPHALFGTNLGGIHEKMFTVERVCDYMSPFFAGARVEKMYLLLINKSEEVVANIFIAEGTVEGLNIDPKYIINKCVTYNAVKAVLAHNHFTGLSPSLNDITTTAKLNWLLGHLGIELVDHIIFYKGFHHSMRNEGEMSVFGYGRIFSKY